MNNWQESLNKLVDAIPPPDNPRFTEGPPLESSFPKLPDDHAALIQTYGSGEFKDSEIGCVIRAYNPFDPRQFKWLPDKFDIYRRYRMSEGDRYMPWPIYPEIPGVFICGWNDSRDVWFWHMNNDDPNCWSTVFYGNMRDSFEYQMPMVVFMQKLLFGEISRRDLNFAEPDFVASKIEFSPARYTG